MNSPLPVNPNPRAALTISECALELGISEKRLTKYVREQGAPTCQRGRRGRGHGAATLLDPDAVLAWLNARGEFSRAQQLGAANNLIAEIAESHAEQFRSQSGPYKHELAANLVLSFYRTANLVRACHGLSPMHSADAPAVILQMSRIQEI